MTPIEITLLVIYLMCVVGFGRVSGGGLCYVLGFVMVPVIPLIPIIMLLRCCLDKGYAENFKGDIL